MARADGGGEGDAEEGGDGLGDEGVGDVGGGAAADDAKEEDGGEGGRRGVYAGASLGLRGWRDSQRRRLRGWSRLAPWRS